MRPTTLLKALLPLILYVAAGVAAAEGRSESFEVRNDQGAMHYEVYVPSTLAPGAPVVVALHGGYASLKLTAELSGWNRLAEELGFLVVYPLEPPEPGQPGGVWKWSDVPRHGRIDRGASLIALATTTATDHYRADRRRVLISGISAGAGMALAVAIVYPDVYAAVAAEVGCAYGYWICTSKSVDNVGLNRLWFTAAGSAAGAYVDMGVHARRLPAIISYGSEDPIAALTDQDQLLSMWQTLDDWVDDGRDNGSVPRVLQQKQDGNANGAAYERQVYDDARGCGLVERWVIRGLPHAYSGWRDAHGHQGPGPDLRRAQYEFLLAQTSLPQKCVTKAVPAPAGMQVSGSGWIMLLVLLSLAALIGLTVFLLLNWLWRRLRRLLG